MCCYMFYIFLYVYVLVYICPNYVMYFAIIIFIYLTDTDKLVFWTCLSKVQLQGVA